MAHLSCLDRPNKGDSMQNKDGQDAQHKMPSRRAILRVRSGHAGHRRMVLAPGQVLQVGRAQEMGLALHRDIEMSNTHFELAWDGNVCRLRDLKSKTGTLLGGEQVDEAVVQHGDWIRAGTTDFSVYLEGYAALQPIGKPESTKERDSKTNVLKTLNEQENLFAVLDAARSDRILALLRQSVEEYHSLYEGPHGEELEEVAPYLVSLPKMSPLLDVLINEGWGNHWGIYLICSRSFIETRRHLRKFLMVDAEGWENKLYFRFYDPRVLRSFLPTCIPEQEAEFFGPIASFLYESVEDGVYQLATYSKPQSGNASPASS